MTERMSLADFKNLGRDEMVDHLRKLDPALVKGKTRAKREDLAGIYKKTLLEELRELANSVPATIEAETTDNGDTLVNVAVIMTIGGEQHNFPTYEEALTFLESKKPLLGADYGRLEAEMMSKMGVDIGTGPDKTAVQFVVQSKDGEKPLIFDNPHDALKAMSERIAKRSEGPVLIGDKLESLSGRLGMEEVLRRTSSEVVAVSEDIHRKVEAVPDLNELAGMVVHSKHVHGPGCGHHHEELPTLAGMESFERVNPEMPMMPFQDGGIISLPPPQPTDFILKATGAPGELNEKQQVIVARFKKAYEAFCQNPADSSSRRDAKSAIYDLKIAGVILSPRFAAELEKGAKNVRDVRRVHRLGVDVAKAASSS